MNSVRKRQPKCNPPGRSCNNWKNRLLIQLLLIAAFIIAGAVGAQDSPADSSDSERPATSDEQAVAAPYVEHSKVELALIEAVVLDRRGRHVRDLTREAFELRVDGLPVELVAVDEIDISRSAISENERSEPPAEAAEDPAEPGPDQATSSPEKQALLEQAAERRQAVESRQQGPRWFLMVFDGYNNVSPLRMSQMRRAAKKWIDSNMREQDLVSIYEFNPYVSSVCGFTADPFTLKDSIDDVRIFPGSSMGQEMISQKLSQSEAARSSLEQQLLNAGTFGNDLLRAERDQFYMNMTSIADVMAGLDGTKAVLLFSGGFPITLTRETAARGGFTLRFKDMLRRLERFGVRVFTYDVGVEAGFTDASEKTNFRMELDRIGLGTDWLDQLQIGAQVDSTNAHHEILAVLGNETGGRFWRGRDFEGGLRAADDDLSHYYLVSYKPAEDGQNYQRIKLKVPKSSYKVVSRRSRFEDELGEPAFEAPVISRSAVSDTPAAAAAGPLEISSRPIFYPAGDQTLVVLPIRVAGPIDPLKIGSEDAGLDIDIILNATIAGEEVESGSRNLRMELSTPAAASLTHGFQVREALLLPPSPIELSVELRLNGLDRAGKWSSILRIPDLSETEFGLTDLALLHPTDPTPLLYDVFRKGDLVHGTRPPSTLPDPLGDSAGRPAFYVDGTFPRRVPLIAQVQVTKPPPPLPDKQSPLKMDWELVPTGGGAPLAPPVRYRRLQMQQQGQRLDVMVDLDLTELEPGDYSLRLTAENLIDHSRIVSSQPITIVP